MPKGEGSPRLFSSSVDALERRMLLSHVASVATVHALSGTASTPAPTVVAKTEVEPSHPATTSNGDVEERDAEEVNAAAQAASSAPDLQYNIPLVFSPDAGDTDDGVNVNSAVLGSSKILRVYYGDEPVAWGSEGSTSLRLTRLTRSSAQLTPEFPETPTDQSFAAELLGSADAPKPEDEPTHPLATKGADLLAPYLPIDRAAMEQAIDRLIDGLEVLGAEFTRDGESPDLIPLPIAWGLGLATVEMIRRRLRSRTDAKADDQPERDPALGLGVLPT